MKKLLTITAICAQILFAQTEPMVQLIVDIGNIMKQKQVNEIMFFEGVRADGNRVISTFVFKPQDKNSKEQVDTIQGLYDYKDAQKEFIQEFAAENKETLCKNKLLPKLKEIDLTYVYQFRFEKEQNFEEASISARECQN
jgi:hypothetical protein